MTELRLVGVVTRSSDQKLVSGEPNDAVLRVLPDGSSRVEWQGEQRAGQAPAELSRTPGESDETLALRTAEFVRGELRRDLKAEQRVDSSQGGGRAPSTYRFEPQRPWLVSTGPAFLASTIGRPMLAWSAEAGYLPGRVGLTLFVLGTIDSTPWAPVEKELEQQQLLTGLRLKFILHEAQEKRFRLLLSPQVGARLLWLIGTQKKPEDRYKGVATALSAGGELSLRYALRSWLSVGGEVGGAINLTLAWPSSNDKLKKKSEEALAAARASSGLDGLFFMGATVAFHF